MIGRIAYGREGGDGSAQRRRSVIYDCLVLFWFRAVDKAGFPSTEFCSSRIDCERRLKLTESIGKKQVESADKTP